MRKIMLLTVAICFTAACATTSKVTGGPDWTMRGSGAFSGGGKAFYGVGLAGPTLKDESLRRETADNRARADLQKIFETYSSGIMKDYNGSDGQLVERVIKTYQNGTRAGVQVVDRYQRRDGTAYSLVKLDLDQFKKYLETENGIDSETRDYLRKKSDAMFEELAKDEKLR